MKFSTPTSPTPIIKMSEGECQVAVEFFKAFNINYINKYNSTNCCTYTIPFGRESFYYEDPGATIACGTTNGSDLFIRAMYFILNLGEFVVDLIAIQLSFLTLCSQAYHYLAICILTNVIYKTGSQIFPCFQTRHQIWSF